MSKLVRVRTMSKKAYIKKYGYAQFDVVRSGLCEAARFDPWKRVVIMYGRTQEAS